MLYNYSKIIIIISKLSDFNLRYVKTDKLCTLKLYLEIYIGQWVYNENTKQIKV